MNKLNKIHGLFVLFVLLILILAIKPSIIKNIYGSFLGRVILIMIVLFFAMNNITLGLLTALVFIIFSNMVFREGLDNMDSTSTTTTTPTTPSIDTSTDSASMPSSTTSTSSTDSTKDDKEKPLASSLGNIDLATIRDSLQAKASSTLPVEAPSSTEDVIPATKESFQSMYSSF